MVDPGRERSQPDHLGRQVPQILGWMWADHPSGCYEEVFFQKFVAPKSSMSWVSNGFNTSLLFDGYGFPLFKLPTESRIIYSLYSLYIYVYIYIY